MVVESGEGVSVVSARVDAALPGGVIVPRDEAELAGVVRDASAPMLVQGNGTKAGMLRPGRAAAVLSTAGMSGITLYSPSELVMRARAGTALAEIEAALAAHGQQMIAEPSHLFGEAQTIGGVVAANVSGPRRISGGAMRDHVLGLRAVNGSGEILNFGGRVLKNVTGLDLTKLLTGSFGTLAVITEVTFKVLPVAGAVGTIVVRVADAQAAVAVMSAGLGSPFSVSGAAYLPGSREVYLRVEDFAESVAYRCGRLAGQFAGAEILGSGESKALWLSIRDCEALPPGEAMWRVSVRPSAGPGVLRDVAFAGVTGFLDWGGGLVWLSGPATHEAHEAVCAAARTGGGVWWLMRGPEALRAVVEVMPPEAPALAALRRQVVAKFDPRGIFNPLKMWAA
ncbi:2-hydroxy-acid oxidase [Acidocella aquatica]|uniref:2-hydroxy-acid oxidase n=1 Tax=Acidocella aquatica TaxID=1922313 RepID=A0ABQ6A8G1_9PROT|nr:FAD-binding protein [Acidocella aquatica]GLR67943.1 2-hydroxy-acid oxidase [Acidocella aquatica]